MLDQNPSFSGVRQEAVLGSSLLVRLLFEGHSAVVKLFKDRSIFDNEVRAMVRLTGCSQVPRLHGHGACAHPLRLESGSGSVTYCHWLCRDWVLDGGAHRLPVAHPARLAARLDDLVTACTRNGIVMADAKRANFVWDGQNLYWLDFGWFTLATPNIAEIRNHEFRDRLLRKLGW